MFAVFKLSAAQFNEVVSWRTFALLISAYVVLSFQYAMSASSLELKGPQLVHQDENFSILQISPRNYFVQTASGKTPRIGSHSGAIHINDELIIIDTHLSPEAEAVVAKALQQVTKAKPRIALNTHAHDDHVGGNSFYNSKVQLLAHPQTAKVLQKTKRPPQAIRSPELKGLAKQNIQILLVGPAHSDGDLLVYDQEDKILYAGDFFVNGYIGYLGEAFFRQWIAAIDKTLELPFKIVVPGHGPLGKREDLIAFKTYLIDFVRSAKSHFQRTGKIEGYTLPKKYKNLGAQFYLQDNLERAFELWKKGELDGI